MLEEAIGRAPDLGIKTLTAGAFAGNELSLRLFERFGSKDGRTSHASRNSTATSKTSSFSDSGSKREQPATAPEKLPALVAHENLRGCDVRCIYWRNYSWAAKLTLENASFTKVGA